jgi:hypothetical protein
MIVTPASVAEFWRQHGETADPQRGVGTVGVATDDDDDDDDDDERISRALLAMSPGEESAAISSPDWPE